MTVLIVDDVRFFRYYLDRLLTKHGHTVIQAASGLQALESLRRRPDIDVVVADLIMPVMDGFEFMQAAQELLHETRGGCDLPAFVLITTLDLQTVTEGEEVREKAYNLGFADVMSKPLDNEQLVERLEAIGCQG